MRPTLPALLALVLASCMSPKKAPTEPVLVAAFDLAAGDALDESKVQTARLPQGTVGTALRPEGLSPFLGQRLRVAVPKGGVLQPSLFEEEIPMGRVVQKKGRAVTLPVAGGEWVHSGDRIDLLATFTDPATSELQTITLLQNVAVLSVDGAGSFQRPQPLLPSPTPVAAPTGKKQETLPRPPPAAPPAPLPSPVATRRLTMLLLPEEAELALQAAALGGLHLTLRHPEDIDYQEERGRSTINTLLTSERGKALLTLRLRLEAARPRLAATDEDDPLPYLPRRKAGGAR